MAGDQGPDPFASQGGGRFVTGVGWVDKNNPQYQYGDPSTDQAAPAPTNQTPTQGAAAPGTTAANGTSTSATPGAPPAANTTNQGTQDTVRNTYLAQATQNPIPTVNDPQIQAQVDPYRAEVERQKNDYINTQAEAAGPYATGALRGQERIASEKAGEATGGFAASLVGNELVARRAEITNALSQLGGEVSNDQALALQKQLADIDAQLKTLGITTEASTAASGQDITKSLGVGNLNVSLLSLLLNNQQANNTLGFNIADRTAYYDYLAAHDLLPPA